MDASTSRTRRPLEAGHVLGERFVICGVLGEGATGIVYDARPEAEPAGERIALKVIHPHLLGDKQIRGRFTREAAILRRLRGEHLCPILDFGEIADPVTSASLLYMAIPKVQGPSLEQWMATEGPASGARVIDIALQICSALSDAHRQGVIHRDLKPANVLLRDGEHAFVVDFGMAKIITGPGGTGTTALTSHNMVFGTPEYMAPEQARGDELDERCDIYALGVILYELLTGKVPFRGSSPLNVLTAHMTMDPPPLDREASGIPPALASIVYSALAKSADERYASASDLARALEHARHAPSDVDGVAPGLPREATVPLPHVRSTPSSPSAPPSRSASSSTGASPSPRTSSVPSAPRTEPPSPRVERTRWALVWALAIVLSIAFGVWLSQRTP
ncbi:serine/threonine-protein kinase [Pendulispora albinea]|uniref:Serine/threonine protein kinase n=1 Tax=Pendulispora albinea TaxID=2741071 RepID=A0ABZ2LUF3_9BACT